MTTATGKTPVKKTAVEPKAADAPKGDGKTTCLVCGKPLVRGSKDGMGATCREHQGKIRKYARQAEVAPEGWIGMSVVCREFRDAGIPISKVVTAAGGDACTKPTLDPVFDVVYVGRRKYMHPEVLTKGMKLLSSSAKATSPAKAIKASALKS